MESHLEKHIRLHLAFEELIQAYREATNKALVGQTPFMDLYNWSIEQIKSKLSELPPSICPDCRGRVWKFYEFDPYSLQTVEVVRDRCTTCGREQ